MHKLQRGALRERPLAGRGAPALAHRTQRAIPLVLIVLGLLSTVLYLLEWPHEIDDHASPPTAPVASSWPACTSRRARWAVFGGLARRPLNIALLPIRAMPACLCVRLLWWCSGTYVESHHTAQSMSATSANGLRLVSDCDELAHTREQSFAWSTG